MAEKKLMRYRVLVPVFAAFAAGVCVGTLSNALAQRHHDTLYAKLEVLAEAFAIIENHYVDEVSPQNLVYDALGGVMAGLDDHSVFYPPARYKALLEATEGEHAAVGIEVAARDGRAEVVDVIPRSPAQQAGIVAGDVIDSVDGQSVQGVALETIVDHLHGEVGSKVVLGIRRASRPQEVWRYTLVRAWIRLAPLTVAALPGGVLHVHLKSFTRHVAEDLRQALAAHPHPGGLIVDLRGNPGGLFDEAVAVSDLFLSDGPIVTAAARGGRVLEVHSAKIQGTRPPGKIAVLIDRGSASASEIVAGALKDTGRARLFGERTYGKASVQSMIDLSDGSGLKLTVARYLTPSGMPIENHGVLPHHSVQGEQGVVSQALRWLSQP